MGLTFAHRLRVVLAVATGACSSPMETPVTSLPAPPPKTSEPAASAKVPSGSAVDPFEPASDAPIATISLDELVDVARESGWKGYGFGSTTIDMTVHHAWFDRGPRSASVVAVDVPQGGRDVGHVGRDRAIYLDVRRGATFGPPASDPDDVLVALVAEVQKEGSWTAASFRAAAERLAFEGMVSNSNPPRYTLGVRRITGGYARDNTAVDLVFFDYTDLRAEGRVLVDQRRVLFVTVCSSCTRSYPWPNEPDPPYATAADVEEARALTAAIAEHAKKLAATASSAP